MANQSFAANRYLISTSRLTAAGNPLEIPPGEEAFLDSILGPNCKDLDISSGLSAPALHAERELTSIIRELRAHANINTSPTGSVHNVKESSLEVATRFLNVLREMPGNRFTMDEVVEKYISAHKPSSPSPRYRYYCTQTLFRTIALATLLYKVEGDHSSSCFQVHTSPTQMRRVELGMAQRPLIALLRHLGNLQTGLFTAPTLVNASNAKTNDLNALNLSNLTISTLISIGNITPVWVDALDQHLKYDSDQRQLAIFRYPSFVVANYLRESQSLWYWLITRGGSEEKTQRASVIDITVPTLRPFVKELINTYRFLFGQNKASRKSFRKRLRPVICKDGCYDPLLDDICGLSNKELHLHQPELMAMVDGQESVFAASELPHFGSRLEAVQEHEKKHRPRKLTDLYRDRRDRRDQEKFYKFWAVIFFGTVAVIIGLVQMLLGAAQLALSYEQWKNPRK